MSASGDAVVLASVSEKSSSKGLCWASRRICGGRFERRSSIFAAGRDGNV
jgi:hypothetical protein